jgi:hypothetical protein
MAFMVVHAGLSLSEFRTLTLREYQAIADAVLEKRPE